MHNYFSVFDLPPAFEIDLADLEKRYFTVQRACHPDRFVGKPPAEKQQAILYSMQANEAYEALKQPLTRARHILALQDIHVGSEKDSVKPSHALLMEIMELREALEEAKTPEEVDALRMANSGTIVALQDELIATFGRSDMQQAAQQTIKLGYLIKIAEEIRLKRISFQS
jgi:molecular chaperone HscB